ncbi:MAG: hypothetical protein WCP55_22100, partial [Lentisphaerota bacterium]
MFITLLTGSIFFSAGAFGENSPADKNLPYPIVDTGQTKCYDNSSEIAQPKTGQVFYGQNGNFQCHPASYKISTD